MATITVSTWPSLTWLISCWRLSIGAFGVARRAWPLARSVRLPAVFTFGDVTVLRAMTSSSVETDENILDFRVELKGVHSELAPDAAALVPTKGRFLVDALAAVDTQHACPDAPCHPQGPADVARPDRARQAVWAVVDHRQQLRLVSERNDAQDRAEDLFLGDSHRVGCRREHGWLQVAPPAQACARRLSPGEQGSALLLADLDVPQDTLSVLHRDQGAHLRGSLQRIADLEEAAPRCDSLAEFLQDRLLDEGPGPGAAVLAGITEHAADGIRGSDLQVRVVEDDIRRFSAQLQRDSRDVRRGPLQDADAGRGLPRERDLVDARVARESIAGARSWSHDHIEDALGQPGFQGDPA